MTSKRLTARLEAVPFQNFSASIVFQQPVSGLHDSATVNYLYQTRMLPHIHILLAVSTWVRLRRLGGPGLVLLGIADNSVIPLTGSMDVLTIWLAARHREPWFYYALMATIGAVLGGYITYSLARKGGKEAMERKLSKRRAVKVYRRFERWGFGAIAIPAILPPPFPFVPFLLAAGAMQYSRKKFLSALILGRGIRYLIAAYLGARYGRHILRFFDRYQKPALAILIGLAVVGGILSLIQYLRYKNNEAAGANRPTRQNLDPSSPRL